MNVDRLMLRVLSVYSAHGIMFDSVMSGGETLPSAMVGAIESSLLTLRGFFLPFVKMN